MWRASAKAGTCPFQHSRDLLMIGTPWGTRPLAPTLKIGVHLARDRSNMHRHVPCHEPAAAL